MFPTFLGGKCKISGFHCSPAACLEVFIPSPFKWSLSSMHLWFSWRFLEFSGSNLVKISGRSLGQWKHHQQCDLSSQVIRLSKTQFIVLIVCKGVTTIIIESDCIQLSFFLILIEKWIFFWVYATPEKNPSIILLALKHLKHCRLFRLIKTWLDPVTAAKIQVIGALVLYRWWKESDVHQLRER